MLYHPNGAIKQFGYGNGIAHALTQNARGLPQVSQDGYVLNDLYAYDQNANVASIGDQAEGITSRSMEYDALNRLKRVSAPALWGDAWYNYDTLDNITWSQVTDGAKARTLTHNIDYATNRLTSLSGSYATGYQYDSQGNIVQRGGQSYSFDIGNRMRSAPGITTHAFDGLGRRTSVVGSDGVNHIYVYGQEGRLLYETTTGQALSSGTKYIYLNRHVVAELGASGVVYDHTDGLGSPVAKTNAGADPISRTRYEPYGATAAGTEPTIGFTGHLNAANLGLVDMQQRFYDPVAGRFLSIDPVVTDAKNGGSFNRYVYAKNNPYKYLDPDGREALSVEACLGGCVGLAVGINRVTQEFALTVSAGAGVGGGVQLDRRKDENGRMSDAPNSEPTRNKDSALGLIVAAYGKVGVELGPVAEGVKAGGGKNLITGQNVGGLAHEKGNNKPGIGASIQGGAEVSLTVKVDKVVDRVVNAVTDALAKIKPQLN